MIATYTTQKSGKGLSHGAVSELSVFLTVKPGHVDELRAACERFGNKLKSGNLALYQKLGLHDMRHVIFDNETRILWITAFETDWDPYIDDSLDIMGIGTWVDWLQHTTEYPDSLMTASHAQVKGWLQSGQVKATTYVRALPNLTLAQIDKGQQVQAAFQQVLDHPDAEEALSHPALAPLLAQAAD
jgi:hypothetical protein